MKDHDSPRISGFRKWEAPPEGVLEVAGKCGAELEDAICLNFVGADSDVQQLLSPRGRELWSSGVQLPLPAFCQNLLREPRRVYSEGGFASMKLGLFAKLKDVDYIS